jgi:RNA polymerase sigma-70 factor (ECF subfamily)
MSRYVDETGIGGRAESFHTTHWSEIFDAKTPDSTRRNAIMDSLLQKYWKPVYCSIRHRGYNNEQAKDLTQGFFQEVVLSSTLVDRADKAKGRFRTFLLTALDHYLASARRKETAKRRAPQGQMVSLESSDLPAMPKARSNMSPDQIFNYVWATEILDEVILHVQDECASSGKDRHWKVFHAKVLVPIIENTPVPTLGEICERYDIENETRASNMMITVKRCFRRILEDQLRLFVRTDSEVEDEFNELLEIVSKKCAG